MAMRFAKLNFLLQNHGKSAVKVGGEKITQELIGAHEIMRMLTIFVIVHDKRVHVHFYRRENCILPMLYNLLASLPPPSPPTALVP